MAIPLAKMNLDAQSPGNNSKKPSPTISSGKYSSVVLISMCWKRERLVLGRESNRQRLYNDQNTSFKTYNVIACVIFDLNPGRPTLQDDEKNKSL